MWAVETTPSAMPAHSAVPFVPAQVLALSSLALAAAATAQTPPAPAAAAASMPAAAASAPRAQAADAAQRIEITGGRNPDVEQRRQSTAAKIVIGRDELDRFGDSTVGEVLRRMPGVTTPGPPGGGGAPRMRGMAGGYTQLLIDGQRVPPGFSLESLNPDQIERIEILRAPTAETGARAIAGTINIITREGYKRRINDLRLGFGAEGGRLSPGVSWTRNDSAGDLVYNLSVSAFDNHRETDSTTTTTDTALATGALLQSAAERAQRSEQRQALNLSSRLQWRLGGDGESLVLQPTLFAAYTPGSRSALVTQTPGSDLLAYDGAQTESTNRFTNARLNGQWRGHMAENLRFELNGGVTGFDARSQSQRQEFDAGGARLRTVDDRSQTRQRGGNLTGKLSTLLADDSSLVGGLELEHTQRDQSRTTLQDGASVLGDFGDDLSAASHRVALYGQREWTISPQWSAYAGLRWEGISTAGELPDGTRPSNRSSVWTPLAHAVWKPDAKSRDQVRLSLTRSYRSPDLSNMLAWPSVSSRYPVSGSNVPTSPDSVGNPSLKPELASGLDVAIERYLEQGGLLSANLFYRRISNLIRSVTSLEDVSWSPVQRWVSRSQNIGDATTQGVELEARLRLDQLLAAAPRIDLRSNLSLYRSRVDSVPGPDNRLAEQPKLSANLGLDYRFRGLPLTVGGNVNAVPGYRMQLAEERFELVSSKTIVDAYALWSFGPDAALRLLSNNLTPRDYTATSGYDTDTLRETAATTTRSRVNLQLRLELKL